MQAGEDDRKAFIHQLWQMLHGAVTFCLTEAMTTLGECPKALKES